MRNWPSPNLKNRWYYFAMTYLYVIALYLTTNHQTLRPGHRLPLTFIDVHTPFLPWTSWIYAAVYVFPLTVGLVVDRDEEVKPIVYSFLMMSTLCSLIFFFYPTVYPRPEMVGVPSDQILALIRSLDTPANCLPSQHVAFAFLTAFFIRRYRRFEGNLAILVAICIAISTLTTKQHYIWDVLTGYFMSRFTFEFAKWKMPTLVEAAQ